MRDVVEFIKRRVREYNENIDTSDYSALTDLMIKPLSSILSPYEDLINEKLNQATLANPELMTDAQIESRASDFFVTRTSGVKATGYVTIYFKTPINFSLPIRTEFQTSTGKKYYSTSLYSITKNTMTTNVEKYPLYGANRIPVEAATEGVDGEAAAGEIIKVIGSPVAYVSVTNLLPISGGVSRDSNTDLKTKIEESAINQSLISPTGIAKRISESYSTIFSTNIKGMGDDEMIRDLYYEGTPWQSYNYSDYYGMVSGEHEYPYNTSRAYYEYIEDDPVTSGFAPYDLPEPTAILNEFTQTQYVNLYKDDVNYARVVVSDILNESFGAAEVSSAWTKSDAQIGLGYLKDPYEIIIDQGNNMLRLGHGALDSLNINSNVSICPDDANKIYGTVANLNYKDTAVVTQALGTISTILKINEPATFSPVIQKQLAQHIGIEINGRFTTSDSSTDGEMSYVTVLRNPDQAIAHDGLGFCWRKGNGNYYNVYLVDNDALEADQFISQGTIIGDAGINNFISAAKREILTQTIYTFKFRITSSFGLKLWIVEEGTEMLENTAYNATTAPGGYLIQRGSQSRVLDNYGNVVTLYTPMAAYSYTSDEWRNLHFGIGVSKTSGDGWWYDDILITALDETYPVVLFKVDAATSKFATNADFSVTWKGWTNCGANNEDHYTNLYIWNYDDSEWEFVDSGVAATDSLDVDKTLTGSYTDIETYRSAADGYFVNLLAFPGLGGESTEINTHYVAVNNILESGIHQGNMVDIYVNAPDAIKEGTVLVSNITGDISINSIPVGTDNFTFPIQEIVNVTDADGDELVRGTDYNIVQNYPALAGSMDASFSISFSSYWTPGTAYITYRYYNDGSALQDLVDSNSFRAPNIDNLIKVMPPVVISIENLEYRDGVSVEVLKGLIKTWVNELTTSFEVTDLIAYLYSVGVTYINLDTLSITYRKYDYLGVLQEDGTAITTSYTLEDLEAFYTTESEITLTKLS